MNVLVSVGIRAYSSERKRQLLAKMQEKLPDPAVYTGHEYTDCFRLGDEHVILSKRSNGDVELSLTCDSSSTLFPI